MSEPRPPTDAAPQAEQQHAAPADQLDTGHEYDGIREHDNKLPNWWLAILFVSVIFGYGYWMHYHVAGAGQLSRDEYAAEMEEANQQALARAKEKGELTDEALATMASNAALVAKGETSFKQSCAACHGQQGQGVIGPNLTDNYWLHGGKPTEILKTVKGGVPAKGMPAWDQVLGAEGVEAVVAYVVTLKGKNVPGKEPQGELASAAPAGQAPAVAHP